MSETIARHCETSGPVGSSPAAGLGSELPLDLQQLVHRCLGRIELAERLLTSFESRFPADLAQVEQCLDEGDPAKMARLCHQLKGAAANISAPQLHLVMSRMEQAVRDGQRESVNRCLHEAQQAWTRFREFKQTTRPPATA
jgi:HPt (histidine-containing phosphotransfer) domain-containing protein